MNNTEEEMISIQETKLMSTRIVLIATVRRVRRLRGQYDPITYIANEVDKFLLERRK